MGTDEYTVHKRMWKLFSDAVGSSDNQDADRLIERCDAAQAQLVGRPVHMTDRLLRYVDVLYQRQCAGDRASTLSLVSLALFRICAVVTN